MPPGLFGGLAGASPFRTLELHATVTYDDTALGRLMTRTATAVRASYGARSVQAYTYGERSPAGKWARHVWRVRWEPPARWRAEITGPGGLTELIVIRDGVAMVYLPWRQTLFTSEPPERYSQYQRQGISPSSPGSLDLPDIAGAHRLLPLLRSPFAESEWDFETVENELAYQGHNARRVRARRRAGVRPADDRRDSGYWLGVDEYECVVDDRLQIILRLSALDGGKAVGIVSADELRVDAPLPPDAFEFVPPSGTWVVPIDRAGPLRR